VNKHYSRKIRLPGIRFYDPEIEPRLFSFNNPHGACPNCDGLGVKMYIDEDLVIPDPSKASRRRDCAMERVLRTVLSAGDGSRAKHYKFRLDVPWKKMKKEHQIKSCYGSGDDHQITYQSKSESTWKSNKAV
jgi:excinuclease ABC subunit A